MLHRFRVSIAGSPWAALVVLCMGFFMVLLDQTIVNVAIPSVVNGLGAQLDQVRWVLSAYTLTFATAVVAVAAVTCLAIAQGRRAPAAAPVRVPAESLQ
jgi:MFS family permease